MKSPQCPTPLPSRSSALLLVSNHLVYDLALFSVNATNLRSPFTLTGSKLCLYLYCKALSQYNTASVLATDHRNDLFVNGFGLAASLLSRYCWWLDPAGAILVSLIILRSWVWTAYGERTELVGFVFGHGYKDKLLTIVIFPSA